VSIEGCYRWVKVPGHHRANVRGYVREHILIAERALGKPLPDGVVVHHHDRDGKNNGDGNLVICPDQAYHLLIHARMRALEQSGNANWKRCVWCKKYDDPALMSVRNIAARDNPEHYHAECNSAAAVRYRKTRSTIAISG